VLRHCVEYGLQVEFRTRYDTEHFRRSGLLLQRLGQLAFACLLCLEQPSVLDRDDGLVGKRGDEVDLAAAEWPNRIAGQEDASDPLPRVQQRHPQSGARLDRCWRSKLVNFGSASASG